MHYTQIHVLCKQRSIIYLDILKARSGKCVFHGAFCRVVPIFALSLLKNLQFLLEWLESDSEALSSVFRLQHTFNKSCRYLCWSLRLKKNNSPTLIHTPVYCRAHFCRSTGCSMLTHMIRHASSLAPPINLEQNVSTQKITATAMS